MITVPGFLLRRLYVKGSLRNTPEGFAFDLRNQLGSGYARQMFPLTVDGEELPLEQCFFEVEGERHRFTEVSQDRPFTLALNRTTTILARGRTLSPGPHRIGMSFVVQGFGRLSFDFTDVVEG